MAGERIAVVFAAAPDGSGGERYAPVLEELGRRGGVPRAVPFREERAGEALEAILACDGALVWVDPLRQGRDRSVLDPILRRAAAEGVFVSAHPDIIARLGTKEVLATTEAVGWTGGGVRLHRTAEELRRSLAERLAAGAPVVVKRLRGNGGQGVWRLEPGTDGAGTVRVLHAARGSRVEDMPLSAFVERCAPLFADGGIIEQPFFDPAPRGMVRCYLTCGEVVGFGHQLVTALAPDAKGEVPAPPPRLYFPPDHPPFQDLRRRMQEEWVPALLRLLALAPGDLPVIWDADFLHAPDGRPVLCEVNASCVSPFPDAALTRLAAAALRGAAAARGA